jgi:hypothetical protein
MWFRRTPVPEVADTLATVSRRLDDIAAGFKRIEGEWDDAYERIMRAVGRLAKRDQRSAAAEQPAPRIEEHEPTNGAASAPDELLIRRSVRAFPGRRGSP